jgi:hypothetical protein
MRVEKRFRMAFSFSLRPLVRLRDQQEGIAYGAAISPMGCDGAQFARRARARSDAGFRNAMRRAGNVLDNLSTDEFDARLEALLATFRR